MNTRGTRWTRMITGTLMIGLLALLIASMPAGQAAPAAISGTDHVTTARLNVRAGPGTDHPIVHTLAQGEVVASGLERVAATGYTWSTVGLPGQPPLGWAADQFTAPRHGETLLPTTGDFVTGEGVTVTMRVNFRTGPGTTNGVIRGLSPGTVITLTDGPVAASGYTWYQGRTTQATGAETGWLIENGITAAAPELPDPGVENDAGATVHVMTDGLRLRAEAGTSAAILARLSRDQTLTVTGAPVGAAGYTWYPVTTVTGLAGWVAADYLAWGAGTATAPASPATLAIGADARVDTARLNLRAGPGTEHMVVGILTAGTPVTIVGGPERSGGYTWYRIEAGTRTGWLIGEALVAR